MDTRTSKKACYIVKLEMSYSKQLTEGNPSLDTLDFRIKSN